MINGIPVFRNQVLEPLGTNDVDYIDIVLEERVYGDLMFSGILAIYLKDASDGWINRQNNLFRFTVPLLQVNSTPGYINPKPLNGNIPDMRNVLYWQLHDTENPLQIDFLLSDVKGKVKLSVEGVTAEGKLFETYEIIEVK